MVDKFSWEVPPLTPEDERLVDAYMKIGRSLDDLPYTEQFNSLIGLVGLKDSEDIKHSVFKRLLRLRKTGRLPRLGISVST